MRRRRLFWLFSTYYFVVSSPAQEVLGPDYENEEARYAMGKRGPGLVQLPASSPSTTEGTTPIYPIEENMFSDSFLDWYVNSLEKDNHESVRTLDVEGNFGYHLLRVKWILETCTDENPLLVILGRITVLPLDSRLRLFWEHRYNEPDGLAKLLAVHSNVLRLSELADIRERPKEMLLTTPENPEGVSPERPDYAEFIRMMDAFLRKRATQLADEWYQVAFPTLASRTREPWESADQVQKLSGVSTPAGETAEQLLERIGEEFNSKNSRSKNLPFDGKDVIEAVNTRFTSRLQKYASSVEATAEHAVNIFEFLRRVSHVHVTLGKRLIALCTYWSYTCVVNGCLFSQEEVALKVDQLLQNYMAELVVLIRDADGEESRDGSALHDAVREAMAQTEKSLEISLGAEHARKNIEKQQKSIANSRGRGIIGNTTSGEDPRGAGFYVVRINMLSTVWEERNSL